MDLKCVRIFIENNIKYTASTSLGGLGVSWTQSHWLKVVGTLPVSLSRTQQACYFFQRQSPQLAFWKFDFLETTKIKIHGHIRCLLYHRACCKCITVKVISDILKKKQRHGNRTLHYAFPTHLDGLFLQYKPQISQHSYILRSDLTAARCGFIVANETTYNKWNIQHYLETELNVAVSKLDRTNRYVDW